MPADFAFRRFPSNDDKWADEVAAAFPQYEIDAASVSATCAIAHETVRTNHPVTGAAYRLLDEEFFSRVFAEVNARAEREMEYAGSR